MSGMFALKAKHKEREGRLKDLKDTFHKYDADGDGQLTPDDFKSIMKDSGHEMSREELEIMFAEKDRDHDGFLSFEEFVGLETKIEKAFKAMDRDGDGFITKSEFKKICRNLTTEQVEAAFAKFDKAGNGKLNYLEFCGMMNARKHSASSSPNGSATPEMAHK
ncbi:calmodulin-like protein 3 isoform X1 [Tigriopus californicus]|uniref:calmodulin-like protein 3 isoform X1 n=1 Tax=Tigriopus californicus TaxID=6832 RepID=UPI0027DA285D|nr:calmodulin-like protein 3 isoform X1 [Tigriopus californicus]